MILFPNCTVRVYHTAFSHLLVEDLFRLSFLIFSPLQQCHNEHPYTYSLIRGGSGVAVSSRLSIISSGQLEPGTS